MESLNTEESYVPTKQERAYGTLIKLQAKSHAGSGLRPRMPVYHDGYAREVYTDTWTLVPTSVYVKAPPARNRFLKDPVKMPRPKKRGTCERCKEYTIITKHHVVHKSKGGGGGSNLQDLCWPCHSYAHNVMRLPSGVRVPSLEYAQVAQW